MGMPMYRGTWNSRGWIYLHAGTRFVLILTETEYNIELNIILQQSRTVSFNGKHGWKGKNKQNT